MAKERPKGVNLQAIIENGEKNCCAAPSFCIIYLPN